MKQTDRQTVISNYYKHIQHLNKTEHVKC